MACYSPAARHQSLNDSRLKTCDIIQSTCLTERYTNCLIPAVANGADEKLRTSILWGELVKKTEEMVEAWWFPSRDKIIYQTDVFYFCGKQQSFLCVWHGKLPVLSSPPPFILCSTFFHTNHRNDVLVAMSMMLRNKVI